MKCPYCSANQPSSARQCEYCDMYLEPQQMPEKAREQLENFAAQPAQQIIYHVHNHYNQPAPREEPEVTYTPRENVSPKNRWLAFTLCLFFGVFGIHRFYVGKVGTGLIYMFSQGIGYWGWGWDILMLLLGQFTDKQGRKLK